MVAQFVDDLAGLAVEVLGGGRRQLGVVVVLAEVGCVRWREMDGVGLVRWILMVGDPFWLVLLRVG